MASENSLADAPDREENNADLWRKLKAAQRHLVTQTEFLNKYRSPLMHPTLNCINSGQQQELSTVNSASVSWSREIVDKPAKCGDSSNYPSPTKEDIAKNAEAISADGKSQARRSEITPSDKEGGYKASTKGMPEEASRQVKRSLQEYVNTNTTEGPTTSRDKGSRSGTAAGIDNLDTPPHPSRDYDADFDPDSESESKAKDSLGRPSAVQAVSLAKKAVLPLPTLASATSSMEPAQQPSAQASIATGQMASSDESDEIILRRPGGASGSPRDRVPSSPHNPPDSGKTSLHNLGTKATPLRKGQNQMKKSKMERKEASPEELEELKRLQAEVIAEAGKSKFNKADLLTSNPEALTNIARRGLGVDPASEISKLIAGRLVVGRSRHGTMSPTSQPNRFRFPQEITDDERHDAQWMLYKEDTRAYPRVENGRLVLQESPTPGHPYAPPAVAPDSGLPIGLPQPPQAPEGIDPEFWEEPLSANWNYYPRGCPDPGAYSSWLWNWLDTTMAICYYIDIYHESFFDGTAHADGVLSLFIPDLDYSETDLDVTDNETRLHRHETADGYRYNYLRCNEKHGVSNARHEGTDRDVYLETGQAQLEPNPNALRANIYLRPAEYKDIPELVDLWNWHVSNSSQCMDIQRLSDIDIRQRIDDRRRDRFPFIVAVERRHFFEAPVPDDANERILGYAAASDFMGPYTVGRHTASLDVFVHPAKMGRGIGRCLTDKLLEVCDPTYVVKQGYFFECSPEDRSLYSSGGSRKLTRLVFTFVFSPEEPDDYNRVKHWLGKYYFVEQGILKGAAVKFNRYMDISYFVRRVLHPSAFIGM